MRRPIMAGNWKMYKTPAETSKFFEKFLPLVAGTHHCDIVICPPFVDIEAAVHACRDMPIHIGGQNLYWVAEGAFTGEVSAPMLKAAGCRWVLVAHSERRQYFAETNETAAKKVVAALEASLKPIYCVGETLVEREANKVEHILESQCRAGLAGLTSEQFEKIALAYEPVWAIGTGKVATPEIAAEAHRCLRNQARKLFGADAAANCRILYGGSVKPDNIRGLMAQPEIDGVLVGGASLDPVSFANIVNF
ncbi:MAG TPA: triose-phosphate isomerase [Bryobacteraceae bacterium]|nr:triose-phosphate isomerase [Bryobacteraceae bacterium]